MQTLSLHICGDFNKRILKYHLRNWNHIFVFFTAPACQGNLQPQFPQEVLVRPAAEKERQEEREEQCWSEW